MRAVFSLAFNDSYRDGHGHEVKLTTWIQCVAWGATAAQIDRAGLGKGVGIYLIDARLREERRTDDQGKEHRNYEATVWQFALAAPRVERPGGGSRSAVAEGPGIDQGSAQGALG